MTGATMLDELRSDPSTAHVVPDLEAALSSLDLEADHDVGAAALCCAIEAAAARPIPISERLHHMLNLIDHEGPMIAPRRANSESSPKVVA